MDGMTYFSTGKYSLADDKFHPPGVATYATPVGAPPGLLLEVRAQQSPEELESKLKAMKEAGQITGHW